MPRLFIDETGNFSDSACAVAMVGVLLPDDGLRADQEFIRHVLRFVERSVPEPFHARFIYNPAYYALCLALQSRRSVRQARDQTAVNLESAGVLIGEAALRGMYSVASGRDSDTLDRGDALLLAAATGLRPDAATIHGVAVGARLARDVPEAAQRAANELLLFWQQTRSVHLGAAIRALEAGVEPAADALDALTRAAQREMHQQVDIIQDEIRNCRAGIAAALALFLPADGQGSHCIWFASGETHTPTSAPPGGDSYARWCEHFTALIARVAAACRLMGNEVVDVYVLCPESLVVAARSLRTSAWALVDQMTCGVDAEVLRLAAVEEWSAAKVDPSYVLADLAAMHSRPALFQSGDWAEARVLLYADGIRAVEADGPGPDAAPLPCATATGRAQTWLATESALRGTPPMSSRDRVWAWEQAVAWAEALP